MNSNRVEKSKTTNNQRKPTQKGVIMKRMNLLVVVMALFFAVSTTFAAGTPAGTEITNIAYGNYEDANGNTMPQVASNEVTTTVSEKPGVDVAAYDGTTKTMDGKGEVAFPISVENTGNFEDDYTLSTDVTKNGDGNSTYTATLYVDADEDGEWDAGETTLATSITDLAADGKAYYILVVTADSTLNGNDDGDEISIDVTAASDFDSGITDTETVTVDVVIPYLGLIKSVSPSGNQPPGTVLTYTVSITNNGTGQAQNVVITDAVPTNTTYETGSLLVDSAVKTDAADTDGASCDGSTVTFNLGSIASGGSSTVSFQVTIN